MAFDDGERREGGRGLVERSSVYKQTLRKGGTLPVPPHHGLLHAVSTVHALRLCDAMTALVLMMAIVACPSKGAKGLLSDSGTP